ncbi:endonuclease domain-containing protein [Runella sp.]|uniref:endonuclease domain-containing protein n=1 Tax=Runella sp. TaxID=1960881 RepID=UPI003D12BB1A
MAIIYNIKQMEVTRRLLRNEQTESEDALWQVLRNRRFENIKFRRQYSVGYFVLDFYCPQEKLAIEVDGNVHDSIEAQQYDAYRTEALNGIGIQVVRFRNEEVVNNLPQVLTRIKSFLKNTLPAPTESLS